MSEDGKRTPTKDKGVYSRTSGTKRHNGKADVCFDITYKDKSGKKIWEKVGWRSEGVSQALAASVRRERMEEIRTGRPVDRASRTLTFGAAYAEWERTHLPKLKEQVRVKNLAELHVLPFFRDRPMNAVTPLELERMGTRMREDGFSDQTILHVYSLIRRVYRKAFLWGIYNGPIPTAGINLPQPDNARQRYLTKDEAARLLGELRKTSLLWHDIALLSLHTGMRLSDILGLRCNQVNLSGGIIDVIASKPGTYTAYLTKEASDMLRERLSEPSGSRLPCPRRAESRSSGPESRFCTPSKRAASTTDRPDPRYHVVFHSLRHTYASLLVQRGVPLTVVSKLMGHATTKMTERYAKLSPDNKKDAAKLISEILSRARTRLLLRNACMSSCE